MKKFIAIILMCMPIIASAQNSWENKSTGANPQQKYLVGAVPVVNGMVTFSDEIKYPNKSKAEIYKTALNYFTKFIKGEEQLEQSRISMNDEEKGIIVVRIEEWLIFKKKAWNLDETKFFYQIICNCSDGKMDVTLSRINYLYDEEREPFAYKAEEWINDEYGLTKKKDKLARVSGKFRMKTIDRKDYIFGQLENLFK